MSQHTTENRALIEELKQDLIVNSILEEQVRQQSADYVQRLETLEVQVSCPTLSTDRRVKTGSHSQLYTRGTSQTTVCGLCPETGNSRSTGEDWLIGPPLVEENKD